MTRPISRREFLRVAGAAGAAGALTQACARWGLDGARPTPTKEAMMASATPFPPQPTASPTLTSTPPSLIGRVALVRTSDRADGVRRAIGLLGAGPGRGEEVFVKPNFNSADPPPGSTHNDSLAALIEQLRARGVGRITVGDRSGMGDTRAVMRSKGVFDMAEALEFETVVFDELAAEDWIPADAPGSHWKRGFALAKPCLQASLVQLCCLKTHRFGGHFTLSLKNSVGMAAKRVPGDGYDYMTELHNSPHQREMIAEINAAYAPSLVVMDGVEAFVKGGPEAGTQVRPEVVLAAADRVALDAVGVAILRDFGTTAQVGGGAVYGQAQLARAAALGLGAATPEQIEIVSDDDAGRDYAAALREILLSV